MIWQRQRFFFGLTFRSISIKKKWWYGYSQLNEEKDDQCGSQQSLVRIHRSVGLVFLCILRSKRELLAGFSKVEKIALVDYYNWWRKSDDKKETFKSFDCIVVFYLWLVIEMVSSFGFSCCSSKKLTSRLIYINQTELLSLKNI